MRPLRNSAIAFSSACGLTPALASASAASVPLASASAISMRSTVTKESPAFSAMASAWSKTRAVSGAM